MFASQPGSAFLSKSAVASTFIKQIWTQQSFFEIKVNQAISSSNLYVEQSSSSSLPKIRKKIKLR